MTHNKASIAALAGALSIVSTQALSAETSPIVVTATRTAQTADQSLSPMVIITREELDNAAGAELMDILHHQPGIDVSRNGGPGQQSSVFIRGAESDHTLILVDGIRINPGTIGTASIQNIPLEMIERIEIVKGPRSTLYGSDAIGGVINIITRKQARSGSRYEANVGGGSFGTVSAGFSAHNNTGDRAAGISVQGEQSDGFPARSAQREDSGYDKLSVNLYGRHRFGDTQATFEHWQARGTTDYYTFDSSFALVPVDQDFTTSTTALSFETPVNSYWVSKLRLSHFNDDIEQNQSTDFVQTKRNTLDWQNDIQAGAHHLLSAGVYVARENTASISFGSGFDVDTDVHAVFVQDDFSLDDHRLVAGARYSDHEAYGDHTTWNLEYGYRLNARWRLIAAANTGFRSPSSTDRFGFGGNPDLEPEESLNREIGVRYRRRAHELQVNAFDNQIDELIVYTDPDGFAGPTPGSNQNIEEARIKGVEASYAYSAGPWRLSLSAVDQDPRNVTDNTRLLRRPEQKYNLSIAHSAHRHDVQLDVTHVSDRVDFGAIALDSYTLLALRGEYRLTDTLTASLRIENAADEEYVLADGFNTPERSYYAKLRYTLD